MTGILFLLLGLFLLRSFHIVGTTGCQGSRFHGLGTGLGHFFLAFLLPCDSLLVVIKIILDLGGSTCAHGF